MNNGYTVHYGMIPAVDIFGMVGRSGGGYNSVWSDWSEAGRRSRELIMAEYETALNELCGHYAKLEQSILTEGIRNPVIITCGLPRKRSMDCLPPELRNRPPEQLLLLETTTGGSRLHIAQKHRLEIACIINDWTGRFSQFPVIGRLDDALKYYRDVPASVRFHRKLGFVELFDERKVGHHLGTEWREDRLMPLRAPLWLNIMAKHGYNINNLPKNVTDILNKNQ